MRFLICAAAVCEAFMFTCTASVQAHGPGGGGHGGTAGGGRASFASGPASGGGFHAGGFQGGTNADGSAGWKANLGQTGGTTGTTTAGLQSLHPNLAGGLNGAGGKSSVTSAGGNSTSTTGGTNQNANGQPNLAGEMAMIHRLEEQMLKQRMGEALRMLEQAKQSNDPQLAAKAQQMLQRIQQQIAQHRSHQGQGSTNKLSSTGGVSTSGITGGSSTNGLPTGGQINMAGGTAAGSHMHVSGGHAGHAGGHTR